VLHFPTWRRWPEAIGATAAPTEGGSSGLDRRWKTEWNGHVGQVGPHLYQAEVRGGGGFGRGAFAMKMQIFRGPRLRVLPGGLGWRGGTVA
jgi:hypothetical protein